MTRQCGLLALSGLYGRGVHGAEIQWSGCPVACPELSPVTQEPGSDSLGVQIVFGDVLMGAGPSAASLRNPTGVALAFRRPGGPRWKRKAGRRAATPAAGSVPARRARSKGPFSGFRGRLVTASVAPGRPRPVPGESRSLTSSSLPLVGHQSWESRSAGPRRPLLVPAPISVRAGQHLRSLNPAPGSAAAWRACGA